MTSMIEKVARALWAARGGQEPFHFAEGHWKALAREAIAAMRDPTPEMCVAMLGVLLDEMGPGTLPPSIPAAAMLSAAIKAALDGEG